MTMTATRTGKPLTCWPSVRQHYHPDGKVKVAHCTEADATRHLERLVQRHPDIEADVYECWCGSWHVGRVS